jgi:Cu/Ag efflux pump CusA
MNISELSLKRPVLATVMNLVLILFGVVGYYYLAVRDYPAIDPPIITVTTSYTGANPDLIEARSLNHSKNRSTAYPAYARFLQPARLAAV